MKSDGTALSSIDQAFGGVPRPEHFHADLSDPEASEHDELLRSRDRDSLALSDVDNAGWDPICDAKPDAIAYFFPKLARFALATPPSPYDWYAYQLIFHLSYGAERNVFLMYCNRQQRKAVAGLLAHVLETRTDMLRELDSLEKFRACLNLWQISRQ
jgi:hypothetical protein